MSELLSRLHVFMTVLAFIEYMTNLRVIHLQMSTSVMKLLITAMTTLIVLTPLVASNAPAILAIRVMESSPVLVSSLAIVKLSAI